MSTIVRSNDAEVAIQSSKLPNAVLASIASIIADMVQDWGDDRGPVSGETKLVSDLGFASVDIIHLVVAIEEHFNKPRLGFQDLLIVDGRYVDDLSVARLADFVANKLDQAAP
jgi:acyl carrier protein